MDRVGETQLRVCDFFQFEIMINVFLPHFLCLCYGMVHRHNSYFALSVRRMELTSVDVSFERLKLIPALKGLKGQRVNLLYARGGGGGGAHYMR